MRNYRKIIEIILDSPDKSNEYILNSSGASPGMSLAELKAEQESLKAIKKLQPKTLEKMKRLL